MDFESKRPKKSETINQTLLMFGLVTSKVATAKGLKDTFAKKNLYLYKTEIEAIVKDQGDGFDGKGFVNFLNELGAIAPGDPKNIISRGSRTTMEKAKQVAPGNEELYRKLAKILESTRDQINPIMPNHKWDFALKTIKKKTVKADTSEPTTDAVEATV